MAENLDILNSAASLLIRAARTLFLLSLYRQRDLLGIKWPAIAGFGYIVAYATGS
jgi:hypothetical protein